MQSLSLSIYHNNIACKLQVALIFFKLHARVGKSACKILKGIFAQFTRQKIGANGRMTVVPAFLRFLDGSFIKKISGEIHKTQL